MRILIIEIHITGLEYYVMVIITCKVKRPICTVQIKYSYFGEILWLTSKGTWEKHPLDRCDCCMLLTEHLCLTEHFIWIQIYAFYEHENIASCPRAHYLLLWGMRSWFCAAPTLSLLFSKLLWNEVLTVKKLQRKAAHSLTLSEAKKRQTRTPLFTYI